MDEDRIKGSIKQIAGGIKEAVGRLLGDRKIKTEGQIEKAGGATQNAIGGMKDTIRETMGKK
jgi:uncharacterized protein YjbJ (UPF0337 family)